MVSKVTVFQKEEREARFSKKRDARLGFEI